jgi:hypothetical protein
MSTTQTVDILKECDGGVKMALAALDDVWEHIREPELRAILNTTRAQHQLVGREVQSLLQEYGGKEKSPNPVARSMSSMMTGMKLAKDKTDSAAAAVLTEGCAMGIQSLHRYLNEYRGAEVPARALCRTLVAIEEQLACDVRRFL